ncbi:glucosylceramidase-like, partial [Paramuricea clavata]
YRGGVLPCPPCFGCHVEHFDSFTCNPSCNDNLGLQLLTTACMTGLRTFSYTVPFRRKTFEMFDDTMKRRILTMRQNCCTILLSYAHLLMLGLVDNPSPSYTIIRHRIRLLLRHQIVPFRSKYRKVGFQTSRVLVAFCDFRRVNCDYCGEMEEDKDVEELNLARQDGHWVKSHFKLPMPSRGGYVDGRVYDTIHEIQLTPPYTSKLLTKMPRPLCYHGAECQTCHTQWPLLFLCKIVKLYENHGLIQVDNYAQLPIASCGVTSHINHSNVYMSLFQCHVPTINFVIFDESTVITAAKCRYDGRETSMMQNMMSNLEEWRPLSMMNEDLEQAQLYTKQDGHWEDIFTLLTKMPRPICHHGSEIVNDKVYIIATNTLTWNDNVAVLGAVIIVHNKFDVLIIPWTPTRLYSFMMHNDFQHWVAGWTDWNLALNMEGGPNWVKNFVDSPIIVDSEHNVFYKQPMYYHLGHFSKFVLPGSFRIDMTSSSTINGLEYIAFLLPNGSKCAVILNRSNNDIKITMNIGRGYLNGEIKASSIQTYLWL